MNIQKQIEIITKQNKYIDENISQEELSDIITTRNKYIDEYIESGKPLPINGCAFCGGSSFSVKYNNGQIVFSKYGVFCCMVCSLYDSEQRDKIKID